MASGSFISGYLQGEKTESALELQDLAMDKDRAALADAPNVHRLHAAQAQEAELKLSNQQTQARLMAQYDGKPVEGAPGVTPDTDPIAARLFSEAWLLQKGGQFEAADKLYQQGTQREHVVQQIQQSAAAARHTNMETQVGQAEFLGRFVDNLDAQSWDMYRMQAKMTNVPDPMGLYDRPWSPELQRQLKDGSMKAVDKARLEQTKARDDETKRNHDREAQDRERRTRVAEDRERRIKDEKDAKAQAGNDKAPTKTEQSDAAGLIKQYFPNLEAGAMGQAAFNVAQEAKRIREMNPNRTWEESIATALAVEKDSGFFKGKNDEASYETGLDKDHAMDASQIKSPLLLKPGRFYSGKFGGKSAVARWNGKNFVIEQ